MKEKIYFEILGYVRCSAKEFRDVPSEGLPAILEIRADLESALEGLFPGIYIYIITEFHFARTDTLIASPGTHQQRGAFALRGSDRPNRIGMTLSRIEKIEKTKIWVNWIDFSDGTPIIDIKRYNPRWECVFSSPRDDRRFFEQQISQDALIKVLARPIEGFAGPDAPEVYQLAKAGCQLVNDHNIFLGDKNIRVHVNGTTTLLDCVQGMLGVRFGERRLSFEPDLEKKVGGSVSISVKDLVFNLEITADTCSITLLK